MKRYSKISGVTIVTCSSKTKCSEEFRSASVPGMIDRQLGIAGWTVTVTRKGRGQPAVTEYHCPKHRPLGPMERRS